MSTPDWLSAMVASSKPKKIGRPPKISRKEVLDAAFALVEANADKELSIRRLATALGVSPGTIYHYFETKEALMLALAEQVLASLPGDVPEGDHWRTRLESWLRNLRQEFMRFPQVLWLIAASGQESKATLETLRVVAEILEREGVPAPTAVKMAQTLMWQVIGFVLVEQGADRTDSLVAFYAEHKTDPLKPVAENIETGNYDYLFDLSLALNLDGIDALMLRQ